MKHYTTYTSFALCASYPVFSTESWENDVCDYDGMNI